MLLLNIFKIRKTALGPYSQAVMVNDTLYMSGALGVEASGDLASGGVEAEAKQALINMGHVLTEAGLSYNNVVKTTVLLADIKDFAAFNAIYAEVFSQSKPARACYQVAALPKGAKVEIEAVAVIGQIVDA